MIAFLLFFPWTSASPFSHILIYNFFFHFPGLMKTFGHSHYLPQLKKKKENIFILHNPSDRKCTEVKVIIITIYSDRQPKENHFIISYIQSKIFKFSATSFPANVNCSFEAFCVYKFPFHLKLFYCPFSGLVCFCQSRLCFWFCSVFNLFTILDILLLWMTVLNFQYTACQEISTNLFPVT